MEIKVPVLAVLLLSAACQSAPKADKAEITDAQAVKPEEGHSFTVDTSLSTVYWLGTKPSGSHKGTFRFAEGQLFVTDSTVTSGQFTIDINSLKNTDLSDANMRKNLENELRDENFFEAGKFPVAKFEITEVSKYRPSDTSASVLLKDATHMIKGNLTIKAITKNITFPAKISMQEGKVHAEANFNIDRTQWGMTYRADKSLQDKLINSIVNIRFDILTK